MASLDTASSVQGREVQTQDSAFHRNRRIFPLLMILPAIVVTLIVVLYPMAYSIYVSFTPYHLLRPERRQASIDHEAVCRVAPGMER